MHTHDPADTPASPTDTPAQPDAGLPADTTPPPPTTDTPRGRIEDSGWGSGYME